MKIMKHGAQSMKHGKCFVFMTLAACGLLLAANTTVLAATCCTCASPDPKAEGKICLTTSGTCANLFTDAKNDKLKDFKCDPKEGLKENEGDCRLVAAGGVCTTISDAKTYQPSASAASSAEKKISIAPIFIKLNVDIPGLRFAKGLKETSDYLEVPYLAQYISAVYRYLLGIVVITAAVMIVYGGFKYVLSASISGIQSGKEIIKDALIGMFLVLGVITILQTLNPATSTLKSLRVNIVKSESFAFGQAQMTTEVATISGTPGAEESSATLAECPFDLTNPLILCEETPCPPNKLISQGLDEKAIQHILREWKMSSLNIVQDLRTQEFFQKIQSSVGEKPLPERLSTIANAAVTCGVHLESCGNAAGTIWELAGIGDKTCLTDRSLMCNPHEGYYPPVAPRKPHARRNYTALITDIPTPTQWQKINPLKCANECGAKFQTLEGCIEDKGRAIDFVRTELNTINGYPDKWLNELQPGDIIQVYTGNKSCGGGHSVLFFGWAGNSARVIQGEFGKKITAGTLCIKKSCGSNMLPVLRIIKPRISEK